MCDGLAIYACSSSVGRGVVSLRAAAAEGVDRRLPPHPRDSPWVGRELNIIQKNNQTNNKTLMWSSSLVQSLDFIYMQYVAPAGGSRPGLWAWIRNRQETLDPARLAPLPKSTCGFEDLAMPWPGLDPGPAV